MKDLLKNTAKFAVGACFALGTAVAAASAVSSSNLGRVVSAGFKGAKNAVEEELTALKAVAASIDESAMFADDETADEVVTEKTEISPADHEN